jgi:hypothetical protein
MSRRLRHRVGIRFENESNSHDGGDDDDDNHREDEEDLRKYEEAKKMWDLVAYASGEEEEEGVERHRVPGAGVGGLGKRSTAAMDEDEDDGSVEMIEMSEYKGGKSTSKIALSTGLSRRMQEGMGKKCWCDWVGIARVLSASLIFGINFWTYREDPTSYSWMPVNDPVYGIVINHVTDGYSASLSLGADWLFLKLFFVIFVPFLFAWTIEMLVRRCFFGALLEIRALKRDKGAIFFFVVSLALGLYLGAACLNSTVDAVKAIAIESEDGKRYPLGRSALYDVIDYKFKFRQNSEYNLNRTVGTCLEIYGERMIVFRKFLSSAKRFMDSGGFLSSEWASKADGDDGAYAPLFLGLTSCGLVDKDRSRTLPTSEKNEREIFYDDVDALSEGLSSWSLTTKKKRKDVFYGSNDEEDVVTKTREEECVYDVVEIVNRDSTIASSGKLRDDREYCNFFFRTLYSALNSDRSNGPVVPKSTKNGTVEKDEDEEWERDLKTLESLKVTGKIDWLTEGLFNRMASAVTLIIDAFTLFAIVDYTFQLMAHRSKPVKTYGFLGKTARQNKGFKKCNVRTYMTYRVSLFWVYLVIFFFMWQIHLRASLNYSSDKHACDWSTSSSPSSFQNATENEGWSGKNVFAVTDERQLKWFFSGNGSGLQNLNESFSHYYDDENASWILKNQSFDNGALFLDAGGILDKSFIVGGRGGVNDPDCVNFWNSKNILGLSKGWRIVMGALILFLEACLFYLDPDFPYWGSKEKLIQMLKRLKNVRSFYETQSKTNGSLKKNNAGPSREELSLCGEVDFAIAAVATYVNREDQKTYDNCVPFVPMIPGTGYTDIVSDCDVRNVPLDERKRLQEAFYDEDVQNDTSPHQKYKERVRKHLGCKMGMLCVPCRCCVNQNATAVERLHREYEKEMVNDQGVNYDAYHEYLMKAAKDDDYDNGRAGFFRYFWECVKFFFCFCCYESLMASKSSRRKRRSMFASKRTDESGENSLGTHGKSVVTARWLLYSMVVAAIIVNSFSLMQSCLYQPSSYGQLETQDGNVHQLIHPSFLSRRRSNDSSKNDSSLDDISYCLLCPEEVNYKYPPWQTGGHYGIKYKVVQKTNGRALEVFGGVKSASIDRSGDPNEKSCGKIGGFHCRKVSVTKKLEKERFNKIKIETFRDEKRALYRNLYWDCACEGKYYSSPNLKYNISDFFSSTDDVRKQNVERTNGTNAGSTCNAVDGDTKRWWWFSDNFENRGEKDAFYCLKMNVYEWFTVENDTLFVENFMDEDNATDVQFFEDFSRRAKMGDYGDPNYVNEGCESCSDSVGSFPDPSNLAAFDYYWGFVGLDSEKRWYENDFGKNKTQTFRTFKEWMLTDVDNFEDKASFFSNRTLSKGRGGRKSGLFTMMGKTTTGCHYTFCETGIVNVEPDVKDYNEAMIAIAIPSFLFFILFLRCFAIYMLEKTIKRVLKVLSMFDNEDMMLTIYRNPKDPVEKRRYTWGYSFSKLTLRILMCVNCKKLRYPSNNDVDR